MKKKLTTHHVPPRSHGAQFTLRKTEKAHRAYHTLFRDAPSLEACIEILRTQWWTPPRTPGAAPGHHGVRSGRRRRNARRRKFPLPEEEPCD